MRGIGQRLLRDSRQKIVDGSSADSAAARDLLSLLVRANMSKDISEAQRLSEEDVLARKYPFSIPCRYLKKRYRGTHISRCGA
jgi:hypothetical protein